MSKLGSAISLGQTALKAGQAANQFRNNTNQTAIGLGINPGEAAQEFRRDPRSAAKDLGRKAGHHAFNEGAETGKTMGKTWLKTFEVVPRLVCRGLQFIFAIIVCAFYGNRVDATGFSVEWVFALVVGGISATTAILFVALTPLGAIPYFGSKLKLIKTYRAFAWDLGLFVAWVIVFGIFAAIFLHRDEDEGDKPYKGSKTGPMKVAVWIDLVNAILWLVSGAYGCLKTFVGGKADEMTDKVGLKLFEKKAAKEKDVAAESV
ncbi:hypothetical protein B0J13DRAFT_671011 [Dactylonectria estremocensis]|uniref:MARVEL domain-containing protein n=1 Tax=Dactylonectria estremocensis TaxID=1079267 RepID=A0A9P9FEJ5_9HYPO|nr:hypothetical protein B0J13DRAFT_671011 [Dactylonectria estremocensis]